MTEAQHTTNLLKLAAASFGELAQDAARVRDALAATQADKLKLCKLAAESFGESAQELRCLGQGLAEMQADIQRVLATPPPSVLQLPSSKPAPKSVPERARQSSIVKRLLRAAVRAGFTPTGFKLNNSNGEITVFTKAAESTAASSGEDINEWDEADGAV